MGEAFYNPVDDLGPERDRQGPRGARGAGRRSGRRGATTSAGCSARSSTPRPTSARSARPTPGRPDPVRLELPEPAPLRPDPRGARPGPRACRTRPAPGRRPAGTAAGKGRPRAKKARRGRPRTWQARRRQGPGKGPARAARGCCSTPSSASIPRPPTTTSSGTIPQALFLMNGPHDPQPDAGAAGTPCSARSWPTTPDNRSALDALYLRVLRPRPDAQGGQDLRPLPRARSATASEAFEDILWSLINSTEFITRR